MENKNKSEVVERLRAKIPNHTKLHVDKIANIIVTVNFLLKKHGFKKPHLIGESPKVIENWYYDNFIFNIRNIINLQNILNEKIIVIMNENKNKQELINEVLYDIPDHTAIFIEMEMLILGRITDLLELGGWTKDKVNSGTPEIIKLWYEEQFDFSLLSVAKMEDALKAKIIQVVNYEQ